MISSQLELIFNQAIRRANALRHEFVTIENILLELVNEQSISDLIEQVDEFQPGGLKNISDELERFLNDENNFSILTDDEVEELGTQQFANDQLRAVVKTLAL